MKNTFFWSARLIALGIILGCPQQHASAQIRFGVAAGLNFTDIDDVDFGSTRATYDSRQGFHVGVIADIPFGPIGIKPGIFYMNAGNIFEGGLSDFLNDASGDELETPIDDDFEVKYVTIPIDVRYRFGVAMFQPYLFVGPELRFRTKTDLADEVGDNLKTFGVAGNFGIGAEVGLFGVRLLPEFRMAFDTSGIIDDTITIGDFEFVADEAHELRTVMLRLGVLF